MILKYLDFLEIDGHVCTLLMEIKTCNVIYKMGHGIMKNYLGKISMSVNNDFNLVGYEEILNYCKIEIEVDV